MKQLIAAAGLWCVLTTTASATEVEPTRSGSLAIFHTTALAIEEERLDLGLHPIDVEGYTVLASRIQSTPVLARGGVLVLVDAHGSSVGIVLADGCTLDHAVDAIRRSGLDVVAEVQRIGRDHRIVVALDEGGTAAIRDARALAESFDIGSWEIDGQVTLRGAALVLVADALYGERIRHPEHPTFHKDGWISAEGQGAFDIGPDGWFSYDRHRALQLSDGLLDLQEGAAFSVIPDVWLVVQSDGTIGARRVAEDALFPR